MAGTGSNPTYAAIQAILKTKYPDGAIPQALYKNFPFLSLVKKTTNFDGDFRVVALQNERPQGSSYDFTTAQGVAKGGLNGGGGSYKRFQVYRTKHYGLLRMDGETMKAAVRTSGALVDLWNQETDGVSTNELAELEFQLFGDGTGVRGTVASWTSGTATIQLATPSDIVYFSIGMKLGLVVGGAEFGSSTPSDSPSSGQGAYVFSINRDTGSFQVSNAAGALQTSLAFNSLSPAAGNGIVRRGDYVAAPGSGTFTTGNSAQGPVTGVQAWIPASVSATPFWTLDRTQDRVRLAGQRLNATGLPMNEALMEAEGKVAIQGVGYPDTIMVNPLDLQNLKKSLGTDIVYDRVQSNIAGISFKAIEYDGANGPMKIISAPFCPRSKAMMLQMPSWELSTLGPAPQMLDFDNNDYLRVVDADQYEVRFGHYGQFICNNPGANLVIDNFGL
jgi:hypothetical protein